MFILDEPYISNFLFETLNKNNYPVYENELTKGKAANLIGDEEFKTLFLKNKKIYTNSENTIKKITEILEGEEILSWIKLFKDKVEFRKVLKEIYPDFYFEEIPYSKLGEIDKTKLKYPFVIKPSIGFLSLVVYTVWREDEFDLVIKNIQNSYEKNQKLFPIEVLNSNNFIIEEFIKGDEYAADVYFDESSNPVLLNLYKHPFFDKYDVSDRLYFTSSEIINKNYNKLNNLLTKMGKLIGLKNFPVHIELRIDGGNIIPIEVNPLRFAGWCLCDLAKYAYNINVYEYFMENKKPNWNEILKDNNSTYAFVMGEVPSDINKEEIASFNIDNFLKDINVKILETRQYDYKTKPMFCSLFIEAQNFDEMKHILNLDMKKYIELKEKVAF